MEKKMQEGKIYVERETYVKNNKTFFSYFIKGIVRGKPVKVAIVPPDNGGYVLLDIVFDKDMAAELSVEPFEMKTDKGEIIAGNTYSVKSVDEDGEVYECKIKPFRQSDKAILNYLLK